MNSITGGNSIEIEVGIEPIIDENYDIAMLSRESQLTLSGNYINGANENVNINISKNITLSLLLSQNVEDLTSLESKVITNSVYKINKTATRIVQIELNSKITGNVYPIKTTTFEIVLPEGAEVEEIISKETYATNGQADRKIEEYSLKDNVLTVSIANIQTDEKVTWKQEGKDNIVVTLKLNGEQETSKENYNIKSKVEFYGTENKTIEKQSLYNLTETADGMITTSIENKEEIYKGKIYSKEEREFSSRTDIEINYANIIGESTLKEKMTYTTEKATKEANVQYKATTISKSEFERVLGTEGTLIIKNQNGDLVKEIKFADFADEESITIVYPENVKELLINISKPIQTGIIRLKHTKVIKTETYKIEQIREFKHLAEQATIKYNSTTNHTEKLNVLNDTKAEVGVTLSNTILSDESKDITITLTLKNDSEKYELFSNPEFRFTFPEGVTVDSVSEASVSATADALVLSTVASKKNQILLRVDGIQQQYITSDINPQITFKANVNIEKLMPNKTKAIKVEYVNKYVDKNNIYQIESELIKVIASNSNMVTNLKIENYDEVGSTIQKHSDSQEKAKGNLDTDAEARNATIKYMAINNYDSPISVMPIIISNYVDNKGNETRLTSYGEENVVLNAGEVKEIQIPLTIPENLDFCEEIKTQTLLEYSYSGTKYQVRNNVELKTIDKDGFRESSIVDNKIKLETFAQLGDGSGVKETDLIYNEQIIKYIIEVTNISNQPITNLNVKNVQQAGNIYDLEEVEVINWVESSEPYIEHRYGELNTNIKEFKIEKIEPGETKELICRVVVKKDKSFENITTANISVSADRIQEQKVQTLNNSVKESNIKISTRKALKEEVDIYGDSTVLILSKVKNLKNVAEEDIKITMFLSDGIYWANNSTIEALDEKETQLDIIKNIKYNSQENYIEVYLTNLEENQEVVLATRLFSKKIPIDEAYRNEKIYTEVDNIISNDIDIKMIQLESKLEVKQKSNVIEGKKIKNDEIVILIGEIKNIGEVDTVISIEDDLPNGLEATKVTLINGDEEIDYTSKIDKDFVLVDYKLSKKDSVTIKIEAKVNTSRIITDSIENVMIVSQSLGETIRSNSIIIDIESEIDHSTGLEEEPEEEPEDPEPEEPVGPGGGKPGGNPEGENPGGNGQDEEKPKDKYYTIEGIAWVDKNKNNAKDTGELLENIIVKIIDLDNKNKFLKDESGKEIEVKTSKDGTYKIKNVPKGNYNIIFKYDTSIYEIEETTKIKNYIIETTKEKVAITNNIGLNSNKTIDLKLSEITEFDLKLDKYITKVVVQTANGTKTTTYTDKKLAREEIQTKYLTGATVLVEYTIKVTNVGDMEGYATQIIDYIPNDMKFYSELNTQWYMGEDGNLYNTSLANEKIKQNEAKELKLVLSKTMSKENAGVTLNTAEIKDMTNIKQYSDINSTNNQSNAEIIVNPATGVIITYIVAILSAITIIAIGIYITNKKVVGKEII